MLQFIYACISRALCSIICICIAIRNREQEARFEVEFLTNEQRRDELEVVHDGVLTVVLYMHDITNRG